jgi:cytochrome c-type biogenesis protein CcmH
VRRRTILRAVLCALYLLAPWSAAAQPARAPGELAVASRLVAPCCWTQTLDVHDSPLAAALRDEIAARLRAGERPDGIEDDLARRYGERIRAVPRDHDPRSQVLAAVALGMALTALAVMRALGRWRRARPDDVPAAPREPTAARDAYHDRIAAELEALD